MAEVITRFRVNVNGVEQDARVCYQNLANKPTFKTINGKAVVVSEGDTDTNFNLATAEETTALRNRVTNLEQNGTGGGGGSGTPYDDTEVRQLITAEQNRATQQENLLQQQLNGTTETANSALSKANTFSDYMSYAESNHATKAEVVNIDAVKQNKLVSGTNIKTINGNSLLGSGDITITGSGDDVDLSNYYTKAQTDQQIAVAKFDLQEGIEGETIPRLTYLKEQVDEKLDEKQPNLVSGTNIKTINGTSILGSGNITISGGGGECSATQDFFVNNGNIYSIALDGTLTLLNIDDFLGSTYTSFMEYCRTNIFQMGGVNSSDNYPDSQNPGRQGARGRFLFGDYDGDVAFVHYLVNAAQNNEIDSMIVECIGGPHTSGAECTMIADIYTVNSQHYHLQVCCKYGNYYSDGWQLVSYGSSSGDLSNYYTKAQIDDFLATFDERMTTIESIANAEEGTY